MQSEQSRNPVEATEQSQESLQAPQKVAPTDLTKSHNLAEQLVQELTQLPNGDLAGEIVTTALKLLRDGTNRGDMKLLSRSLKELRYAVKVFAPYHEVRKVSIFGSARTPEDHPDYLLAEAFARGMAQAGWMVLTGAGGGIMAAGHGGAGAETSFGLAIRLPFEQKTNVYIADDAKLINFRYFFTRKVMFVRGSHALALFPGGFGTLDEGFEVLTLIQTGRAVPMPIVMLDRPGGSYWRSWQEYIETQLQRRGLIGPDDHRLYKITDDVTEAILEIRHFYSNYHSVRYTRDEIALRLHRQPTPIQLAELNDNFADIDSGGGFRASGPLEVERDEPALSDLPRLVFAFNRRDYGRLRMLIDYLNDLPG